MTCYFPIKAYRSQEVNPETGKRQLTFKPTNALIEGSFITLPCGRCVGCQVDRARDWAVRCMHEAQMYSSNSFLTLTYSNEHVPQDYSVKLDHFQKFMKRLRKAQSPSRLRFLACGEYGDEGLRPHYHALIFNHNFNDKKLITIRRGNPVFSSHQLSELWPHGSHEIGNVTFKSAAYTARYALKKVNGTRADDHYLRRSPVDGQLYRVASEFLVQSKGLGRTWFDKFKSDAFPCDFLIVDGRKCKPPRAYLKWLEEDELEQLKRARKRHALTQRADNTKERLAVREKVHSEKLKQLKRSLT